MSAIIKVLMLLLLSTTAFSEEIKIAESNNNEKIAYVSDNLVITIRSGEGRQFPVIKAVSSGTVLLLLSEQKESGYVNVRTEDGLEGWVQTQYISEQPIHRDLLKTVSQNLKSLESKAEKLQSDNDNLTSLANKLKSENTELKAELKKLGVEGTKMTQQLRLVKESDSKISNIMEKNSELNQQYVAAQHKMEMLEQTNEALQNRANTNWFLAGAGVLIVGLVIGLVIPATRRQKKSDWNAI